MSLLSFPSFCPGCQSFIQLSASPQPPSELRPQLIPVSPQPPSQTGQSQCLAQNRPKKKKKKKKPSVEMKHGCQLLTLDYKPNLDFANISKYPDRLQRGVGNGHGRAGGRPGQGVMLRGSAQSCPTLCNPMDCSPPGSSAHGIFQARILEWGATSFSRGSNCFVKLIG